MGAYVTTDPSGKLVLVDPVGAAVVRAVAVHNCRATLADQGDRVAHFVGRMAARHLSPAETVVVLINVDTPWGAPLADALMPGADWDAFRQRGETPFARGLAGREGFRDVLSLVCPEVAAELDAIPGLAVVVVDHGTAAAFEVTP